VTRSYERPGWIDAAPGYGGMSAPYDVRPTWRFRETPPKRAAFVVFDLALRASLYCVTPPVLWPAIWLNGRG
jgi:hypothetical protein